MKNVEPLLDAPRATIGAGQAEYEPVVAAQVKHPYYESVGYNTLAFAFEPTAEERARIAAGENIYVSLLTFGGMMQPLLVTCGADETAAIYNVRSTA